MKLLRVILLLFIVLSCKNEPKPAISFYYWKTRYALTTQESKLLTALKVQHLYIRYFDVGLSPQSGLPIPVSPILFVEKPTLQITPVVYIQNKVLLNKNVNVSLLAQQIHSFINQINKRAGVSVKSIQLDCDWTENTKVHFFKLIEQLQHFSKTKITSTVRLHQIKYPEKMGVPPVAEATLMYYNMGVLSIKNTNSIYDKDIANKYVNRLHSYPKNLNVALPIYSWVIQFRNGKIISLTSKISEKKIANNKNYSKKKEHFYSVLNSHYLEGVFYKKGDLIKIETISEENLLEMAKILSNHLQNKPKEVIFYDLDEQNINTYEKEVFTKVVHQF